MRWLLVLAVVAAACAAGVHAQLSRYTVVAKTMSEAKIVPTEQPHRASAAADRDELGGPIAQDAAKDLKAVKPKPAAKGRRHGKRHGKGKGKGHHKGKHADAKKKLKKAKKGKGKGKKAKRPQPGAASKAAKAAIVKAPKDQLMKWVRGRAPLDTPEAEFKRLEVYLNGQNVHTFEDLLKRGEEGIKELLVGDKWRSEFMELLIRHIGDSRGVDDHMMVPTHKLVKGGIPKKKSCHRHGEPRFRAVAIPKSGLVGDWLKTAFPKTKPLRMSRTVLALQRQTVRTFADLRRIGVKGVKRLLYVPEGVREALYEAVLEHIGRTEGHDDGSFVTAKPYVPPLPTRVDDCSN